MSERDTRQCARRSAAGRFGARFWEGVESEIEALDPADFALFLGAHQLGIEPRPGFESALGAHLGALVRRRWSN